MPKDLFNRWCLVIGLLLFIPLPGFACSTVGSLKITIPSYTHSSPADSNWIGRQLGNSMGQLTNYRVFEFSGCTYGSYSTAYPVDTPLAGITHNDGSVSYPVYPTGVPGIGYVVGLRDPNASQWISVKPPSQQIYPAPGTSGGSQSSLGFSLQMKLVATDRLKTGTYTIPDKVVARLKATDSRQQSIPGIGDVNLGLNAVTITVNAGSCTVTPGTALQTVTLPTTAAAEFKGVGDMSIQSATFSVALTCDPDISVYATMTDAAMPANTSDTLSLNPASSASGIGLKLYKSGESIAVKFGPDSSGKNNTNQWYVDRSSSASRNITIPFRARYIQTKPEVKAGSVKATSTITFSYQ